jgi:hypothetical protein
MGEDQAATTEAVPRSIKAGGETYEVSKFTGYKAFRIGRLLTTLGEIGPELSKRVGEFTTEYRKTNVEEIPRATLEFRYSAEAAAVSDEAWKESNGVITLSNDPSEAEILAVVLPTAFELAGDRVADLLAWVIADDKKLEELDAEGEEAVKQYIDGLRRTLLFNCTIDELFDIAIGAQAVLGEQMAGKAEQARSLLPLVGLGNQGASEEEAEDAPDEGQRETATVEIEGEDETRSTPESQTRSEKPDSSTDSPLPTGGDEAMSSSAPAGQPSASISG